MKPILLSDWVTVRGTYAALAYVGAVATVTQGETSWADVGDYEDLVIYLDVKEVTGTVTLQLQTSPSRDDVSFLAMVPPVALTTGTRVMLALAKYAFVPVSRYVRWQLVGLGTPYDATFRVFIGAS